MKKYIIKRISTGYFFASTTFISHGSGIKKPENYRFTLDLKSIYYFNSKNEAYNAMVLLNPDIYEIVPVYPPQEKEDYLRFFGIKTIEV